MNSNVSLISEVNATESWFDTGWSADYNTTTSQDFVTSIHNASSDYLPWKDRVTRMWQITCPALFILGNFDNVMVILIMRRMLSNDTGFPLLFTALAVTDLLFLYVVLLPHWVLAQFGYSIRDSSEAACKLQTWMVYSLVTLSAWLLAAMTVQRAIHIVCPFKMLAKEPRRQALRTIAVLTPTSFFFCSFALYGATTQSVDHGHCWWSSELDPRIVRVYYSIATFLNTVLPFFLIIVCNILMIRAVTMSVQRQADQRSLMMSRPVTQSAQRLTDQAGSSGTLGSRTGTLSAQRPTDHHGGVTVVSRMTVTLIVVSFVFIVLTMPMYIMRSITQRVSEEDGSFYFWANFTDLMGVTNSAINFCLYIMTGSRFRREVKKLFCKKTPTVHDHDSTRTCTRNIIERTEHTKAADF